MLDTEVNISVLARYLYRKIEDSDVTGFDLAIVDRCNDVISSKRIDGACSSNDLQFNGADRIRYVYVCGQIIILVFADRNGNIP